MPRLTVNGSSAEFDLWRRTLDHRVRKRLRVMVTDIECDREAIGSSILLTMEAER